MMTRAFWIITAASVPAAFLLDPGIAKWLAIGWPGVIGTLVSLSNWAILAGNARHGRRSSLVPIMGGFLLAAALSALSIGRTSHLMILGCLLDPWLAMMVVGPIVVIARRLVVR